MSVDNINILNRSRVVEANLNFGSLSESENYTITQTVVSDLVTSNSRIICTMNNEDEDFIIQEITFNVNNILDGSFDVVAHAPLGATGILKIYCLIL